MSLLLYLDTNVFLYLKEGFGERADLMVDLLAAASATPGVRLATSDLSLAEALPRPLSEHRDDLVDYYEQTISPSSWLHVSPVSRDILRAAAVVRAGHRSVKLPDAIHIATASHLGCRYFLTGDTGLKGEYPHPSGGRPTTVVRPDPDAIRMLISELAS